VDANNWEKAMAAQKILYVCYDPSLLLSRERLLLGSGYDVTTLLGTDGVIASTSLASYDCVVLGDEGTVSDRQTALLWLKSNYPALPVVALVGPKEVMTGADQQASLSDPRTCVSLIATTIRRQQAAS
jgi:CheY-like chemotaxis protein